MSMSNHNILAIKCRLAND